MIDPRKVTKFDRTKEELEEFLLFAIVVAGKGAFQQAAKLEAFLSQRQKSEDGACFVQSPFEYITDLDWKPGRLVERLREVKMGQYDRVSTAFRGVAHLFPYPLFKTDISMLECIKGIGMKTARFFAMHTRPNVEYACLDTHILRWLSGLGYADVPKSTPRGEKYLQLESIFLQHARHLGKTPSELDLEIWNSQHVENSSKKNLTAAYTSAIVAA